MAYELDVLASDDVLFELLRRGRINWQDVLIAGGVDSLEAEHREFLEVQEHNGSFVVLTAPL